MFLVNHQDTIGEVFVAVLRLCAQAGLVSVGTIAIDGTKIGSDAALDRNHSSEWIRSQIDTILAEAFETDEDEDAQPGLLHVDELPVELSSRNGRLATLQAALAVIEAQDAAAAEQAAERAVKARTEAAQGRKLKGRKPKDPHGALARAEADEQAVRVRARAKLDGSSGHKLDLEDAVDNDPEVTAAAAATAEARAAAETATSTTKANVTDPQSRIMKTAQGWVQGYNVQAAVTEHQIIVAAEVSQDANDVGLYQPMVAATRATLDAAGIEPQIGTVLADAGYWSEDNATVDGPDRLIATLKDHKQRRAARELGTTAGPRPTARPQPRRWNTGCAPKKARPPTRNAPTPSNPSSRSRPTTATSGSAGAAYNPPAASGR
jgi:hypothetical protein